jgi:hypothetical protein
VPSEASRGVEYQVLEYTITYERSAFTKAFAVFIVINMWLVSIYMLVIAIDNAFVRPR